ncbi:MAG: hypothetical protein WC992_06350 [Acholeplasmataceae bacterium]
MTEQEMAAHVVEALARDGWEVYPEVRPRQDWPRADIVAVMGRRVMVVETKLQLNLTVTGQAWRWQPWAHWVYVATSPPRLGSQRSVGQPVLDCFLRQKGIGQMLVDILCDKPRVAVSSPAGINRTAVTHYLLDTVCEQHRAYAAGNARQEYYTPFRETRQRLVRYVTQNSGCTLKEAIAAIAHHYKKDSTAAACLAKWVRDGVIDELELCRNGKRWELQLAERGE